MAKTRIIFLLLFLCSPSVFLATPLRQGGFIPNHGQIIDQHNNPNPDVLYVLQSGGIRLQLRPNGFSYELATVFEAESGDLWQGLPTQRGATGAMADLELRMHRVDLEFVQGNAAMTVEADRAARDHLNYYTEGVLAAGRTHIPLYQRVTYRNVWGGIDLEFLFGEEAGGKLKYNFIVHPGANPADIKLLVDGPLSMHVTPEGALHFGTSLGAMEDRIPYSYVRDGQLQPEVDVRWQLNGAVASLETGTYDPQYALVIDPDPTRLWSSYYGGTGQDHPRDVCRDVNGDYLIVSTTASSTNIASAGAHQTTYAGGVLDMAAIKMNAAGVRIWATYYGGSGQESGVGIAADPSANVFMSGMASGFSTNLSTSGAHQEVHAGSNEGCLVKFDPAGVRLWCTYYGSTGIDNGWGCATDAGGNVYMTGNTQTGTGTVIATAGAHQPAYAGNGDAFLVKFDPNGARLWGTYFGGTNFDNGSDLVVDSNGDIILTGWTRSWTSISTPGTLQPNNGFLDDTYIAKFNPAGVQLWGTYYGGFGNDRGNDITVDCSDNIIVVGETGSTDSIAFGAAHQGSLLGFQDMFVARLGCDGTGSWGTYLGGSLHDNAQGVTTDACGNIYVTGEARSMDFPVTAGAFQTTFGGGIRDGGLAKLSPAGALQWATYIGGSGDDLGYSLAQNGDSCLFFVGQTRTSAGMATVGAHQTTFGGGGNNDLLLGFYCDAAGSCGPCASLCTPLPLAWQGLAATRRDEGTVGLDWQLLGVEGTGVFAIERSADGRSFRQAGVLRRAVTAMEGAAHHFEDVLAPPGSLTYRIRFTDANGFSSYSPVIRLADGFAAEGGIHAVRYDPYGQHVALTVHLEGSGSVHVGLYDGLGRKVLTLDAGTRPAGTHALLLSAPALADGVYVLRLHAGTLQAAKKFLVQGN